MSASEPEEVHEPRENVTELQEASSYKTWSGRSVIKLSQNGKQQTVKLVVVKRGCYVQPFCVAILFVFVWYTSVVFMLLYYLSTTPCLLCSNTKVHPIYFIYHIPFHLFHLPRSILVYFFDHSPSISYLAYLVILVTLPIFGID